MRPGSNSNTTRLSESATKPSRNRGQNQVCFPYGLKNASSIYKKKATQAISSTLPREADTFKQETPLAVTQEGLVFSTTTKGKIVHRPDSCPTEESLDSSQIITTADLLPYQEGEPLGYVTPTELCACENGSTSGCSSR